MKIKTATVAKLFLALTIIIYSSCNGKKQENDFQEMYPELSALEPELDTFSIDLNTYDNLPHYLRNQFYLLASNPSTGFIENYKAVAGTPVFNDIFIDILKKCGITINKNSLITVSHNVRLGDVYQIARQSKQVQTYQTTMNMEIKPEWSKSEEKSIDCIGTGSGTKGDSVALNLFKIKLNSRLSKFSFANVEFTKVKITEVEAIRIKKHILNDLEGVMAEAMAQRNNFVAVRTVEFPEITFSFISKISKGGKIDIDEPLKALELNPSQVSRTKQRNDTVTVTFKNISAITDFIRYEDRSINKKR